mgnify:FL=1
MSAQTVQRYELRWGPPVAHLGVTSWIFRCVEGACSWHAHRDTNLLGNGLACSWRFTTLESAQRACESRALGCYGITMDNGAACLGDAGSNTAGKGCRAHEMCAGVNKPRRFRVAVAVHGLLRQPCVVPMLLNAIDPRDDIFVQANFWRFPQNARTGDFGKMRVALHGYMPLIERSVSFSIYDQAVSDRDKLNIEAFRVAVARGDPYTASINNQTLRNACRALVLLDRLATAIETYEADHGIRYDVLVCTRLDVLPLRPIVTQLPLYATRVVSPSTDRWSGLNDRLMAGKRDDVIALMRRVHLLKQFFASNRKPLLVEPFLAWCAARQGIVVVLANPPFGAIRRVRTSGFVEQEMHPTSASCPIDSVTRCEGLAAVERNATALRACGFNSNR